MKGSSAIQKIRDPEKMSDPVRLIYPRPAPRPSQDDDRHAPTPPARYWKVVRRDDRLVLARYASKPKAYSAATRFSADGCTYDVVEDFAPPAPKRLSVASRTHASPTEGKPNAQN